MMNDNKQKKDYKRRNRRALVVLIIFSMVILNGSFRIYHGGSIGLKIVQKDSFSFKDTFVNLDDLLGQPRIAVAINHPAVKRQLEEMGFIETDEQIKKKVQKEMEAESEKRMLKYKEEMKRIQRHYGY